MLRDWGPGSVRTPRHTSPGGAREAGYTPKCRYRRRSWLAVPRARRARACKARKTHQAWPGEEGGEGGGEEAARRPAEGRMTEFFGFFSPECHLTVCFSPECHLTAWPQFLSAARPRAAAAFYFSQSASQDKLPTPARPTRGRRCVMPGRAGPAGGEGEGEGVPSSASGCAGVAAPRGGGEALEDGGGGQGGGHGDPPSRRSREEGGESPLSRGMGSARQQQQQQQSRQ